MKAKFCTLLFLLLASFASVHKAESQGTAFTYQGRLNASGSPANGNYDMQVSVYTVSSGGSSIAGPLTTSAVGVTNGLFTVTLDFGSGVFTGSSNWLDIMVRASGAGMFTELTPRQPLTPSPYAIYATTANNISSANLSISGTVFAANFQNGGNSLVTGGGNVDTTFYSFVGGADNTNHGSQAFLGAGTFSILNGSSAFIGAGQFNTNSGPVAMLGAGQNNSIGLTAYAAVIGGGGNNQANGQFSTVPGGESNLAGGNFSFAAGFNAQATNVGSFVWADSQSTPFTSSNNDSFNVRAQGGVNLLVGGTTQGNGNNVQFINEGIVPGMVISNNNAFSGHLRFRNYLEIQPNLANTAAGGLDVRNSNGFGNIFLDGSTGTVYASNFSTFNGNGDFIYGVGNVITGTDSFVGGENNTNNAFAAFVGGGELNNIQSGSDTSVVGGGNENIIYSGATGSTISGGTQNFIGSGALSATIGGGILNTNGGIASFIGGGHNNIIQSGAPESAIVGGLENIIPANAVEAAIVGGQMNTNGGSIAMIGGGIQNFISSNGLGAVIGGGALNVAATNYTTIPGGSNNLASGVLSFAAGANAHATNQGAFVWSDSEGTAFSSSNNDSFNVRAQGGVSFVTSGAGLVIDGSLLSGQHDLVDGYQSSAGGVNNTNHGRQSVIVGGTDNLITAGTIDSVIGGGDNNTNGEGGSVIGGGEQNSISAGSDDSAISGGTLNRIQQNAQGAFIGGGLANTVLPSGSYAVIGGGTQNTNGSPGGTIGGGGGNISSNINNEGTVIGGGFLNTNNGNFTTIGGGISNLISSTASSAVIGGGVENQANASSATVPGGSNNLASGIQSFAAGGNARATNQGAFVWADSQSVAFTSTNNDSFNVRAQGGVRLFVSSTNTGDGNTVQFIDEGGVTPGMVISNNNGNSGHLRFRNYLEIQPNLAGTVAGGLDVRNAGGIATITLNGANGMVAATTFSGSGSGLTGLPAANLSGSLPSISGANLSALPANAALLGAAQSFTAANTFTGQTAVSVVGDVVALSVGGNRTGSYTSPIALVQNLSTIAGVSPALRVSVGAGNAPNGALSVSANAPITTANSLIAQFGNSTSFVLAITNDGSLFSASNLVAVGDVYARGAKLTSDRNAKENFAPLDVRSVLDKVTAMPVTEWNYKTDEAATRHIGPVAQDFYAAFGLDGNDDKHISTVDEGGVALAAIQGLNQKLESQAHEKDAEIEALKKQNDSLAERLNKLEATMKLLAAQK